MDAERAPEVVQNGGAGLIAASHEYSAPQSCPDKTLRCEETFCSCKHSSGWQHGGIPPHVREELVNHILQLEE
jgi:hypothetical protein